MQLEDKLSDARDTLRAMGVLGMNECKDNNQAERDAETARRAKRARPLTVSAHASDTGNGLAPVPKRPISKSSAMMNPLAGTSLAETQPGDSVTTWNADQMWDSTYSRSCQPMLP